MVWQEEWATDSMYGFRTGKGAFGAYMKTALLAEKAS